MESQEIEIPICNGDNNINGRCCDSRGIEECAFCVIIKNNITLKVCNTLCRYN